MALDLNSILKQQDPNAPMSTTQVSGNTPGAMQYADGGQATMMPPQPINIGYYGPEQPPQSSQPSPYVSPTTAPTIAETLANIKNQALAIQGMIPGATSTGTGNFNMPGLEDQTKYDEAYKSGLAMSAKEEEAIRRAQLKMYQREIDATNKIYDQMYREELTRGQGRIGSTTAIGARSGILGSDFANTQQETIKDYNTQIQRGIQEERALKIATIMGTVRKAAADEIAAKNAARKQGADALIEHYKSSADRKSRNISAIAGALVSQGIDPSSMDEKSLKEIATQAGTTVEDIIYNYQTAKDEADAAAAKADLETRKTESEIAKNSRVELGEGSALVDADGNVIYKNPKTYAPSSSDASVVSTVNGSTPFSGQKNYANLTVKQKQQADSLNNLIREIDKYKTYYAQNKGAFGGVAGNMFGGDSGQLETMFNSIIFAAAQAEGTGALQKPDREVIEKIIPNPTSISGAWNTLTKGGADANDKRLQDQIDKYTNNLRGYGLEPVLADPLENNTRTAVKTGTLPNGTAVTQYSDGTIEDAHGNTYDEDGNPI